MKQIIQHEQCQRCQECCRFREDRQYFAPLFTASEIEAIRAERGDDMPEFVPYKDSHTVFQIRLVPSKQSDGVYPYVCPFLDEDAYACSIYNARPFDCQTWPFLVNKVIETGRTLLTHFTGDVCLALNEVTEEDFNEYKAYFAALLSSPKYLQLLKQHPELVWEHHEDGNYRTVLVADITGGLIETETGEAT